MAFILHSKASKRHLNLNLIHEPRCFWMLMEAVCILVNPQDHPTELGTIHNALLTIITVWCVTAKWIRKWNAESESGTIQIKSRKMCFTVKWHQRFILTRKLIRYQLEVKMEMGGKDPPELGTCMFLTCADVPQWWLKLWWWFRERCVNKRFTLLSSQGLQTLEVNEAWSVKTSWDGMS